MATAALTALLTDITLDDDGSLTGLGTSNSEFVETVLNRQGADCGSNGHNSTLGPTVPSNPNEFCGSFWTVTQNLTNLHLHVWLRGMYPLRSKTLGGLSIYVGDGTNTGLWYISGSDVGYSGDWLHAAVDCSRAFDVSSGAPNLASITEIGGAYNISATKGADILYPFFFDAIRKENGSGQNGIRILGGTTGDRLLFSDLPVGDQTLRTGIAEIARGNIFCGGEWHFGNAASTMYLQDDSITVNMADLPVASDYFKIIFNDGTTGVTDFRVTKLTWKGVSRALPFDVYDTSALGAGDTHDCPDEIFNFFNTITFGAQTTKLRPIFNDCVTIVPSGITLTNPSFNNCDAVTLTAANDVISNGTVLGHNTLTGVAFITTDSLAKINDTSFDINGGVGHAVRCDTIGTYNWVGNTDTGYTGTRGTNLVAASGSTNAMFYNNSGGLITLNVAGGGQSPSVRNGAGATTQVNATVNVTFDKMKDNTEVRVYNAGTFTTISGGYIEDAIAGTVDNRSFVWSISAGSIVDYQLINSFTGQAVFENIYVKGFTVPAADVTVDIAQRLDRNAA